MCLIDEILSAPFGDRPAIDYEKPARTKNSIKCPSELIDNADVKPAVPVADD